MTRQARLAFRSVRVALPGLRVLAKDEAGNETGSHKQRAAAAVVCAVVADGHRGVSVGTCGNYGLAMAIEAHAAGLATTVVMPAGWANPQIQRRLASAGAQIHQVVGGYEDAVATSKVMASAVGLADGNVDGPYSGQVFNALTMIADEIAEEIHVDNRETPSVVWVPLGNGTTAASLAVGMARHPHPGRVVAVTGAGSNSILASWPGRGHTPVHPDDVTVTPVREPLVNSAALHGQECLDALHRTAGRVIGVTDQQLLAAQRLLHFSGVAASPAGAAGLAGLMATRPPTEPVETHVVLITGR